MPAKNAPDKQIKETSEKTEQPICFVIMPFTNPDGYEENHFRKVYDQIFVPAIESAGYKATRVDEDSSSATIQTKILTQLIHADMVLCDLSSKNPNVLYELGMRHAFDKPVVLVQEQGQGAIFDVGNITTIPYRKERRYDEVLEDQKNITEAISQTAESKQKYSVMSAVKMEAARPINEDDVTHSDQILYWLQTLSNRMDKIDLKIRDTPQSAFDSYWTDRSQKLVEKYTAELHEIIKQGESILYINDTSDADADYLNAQIQIYKKRLEEIVQKIEELDFETLPFQTRRQWSDARKILLQLDKMEKIR